MHLNNNKLSRAFSDFFAHLGLNCSVNSDIPVVITEQPQPQVSSEPSVPDNLKRFSVLILLESGATLPRGSATDYAKWLSSVQEEHKKTYREVMDTYLNDSSVQMLTKERLPFRHRLQGNGTLPVATTDAYLETLEILANHQKVKAIIPNQEIYTLSPDSISRAFETIEEKSGGYSWGLEYLQIEEFWKLAQNRGEGVKVGVIDTGVDGDHPALQGKIADFAVISHYGKRIPLLLDQTFDSDRHGTHVCGIIVGGATENGVKFGVAPEAKLCVVTTFANHRVEISTQNSEDTDAQNQQHKETVSSLMDRIGYCIDKKCKVINLSLGMNYYDEAFEAFLSDIINLHDVPIVCAIGNSGKDKSDCPGNKPSALGVGACSREGNSCVVAEFSGGQKFSSLLGNSTTLIKPDIVAPGVEILSCVPMVHGTNSQGTKQEFCRMSGTSMASPFVAGVVAVLRAANPDIDAMRLLQILKQTAEHPSIASRPDTRYGYGCIQPLLALRELRSI